MSFQFTGLLKLFYRSGLPYLPVLSGGIAEHSPAAVRESPVLIGFLARRLLDRQAADLERINETHERLPLELLITDSLPGDLIGALSKAGAIPVLDLAGREVRTWSSSEFLAAVSAFQLTLKEKKAAPAASLPDEPGEPSAAPAGGDWLSRVVLSGFPHPLFATDLKGKTIFYNEAFEAGILVLPVLRNSLRQAETYFLDLTRELLARSLQKTGGQDGPLRARLPEMQMALEIATLENEGRVMGYLYIFRDLVWTGLQYELRDMLAAGIGLDGVVDEIEGALIYQVLKEHGQNVSHAAQALKVKRSTLQNKIKRLQIDEKYDRRVDGPIRRKRRPGEMEENARQAANPESGAGRTARVAPPARSDVKKSSAKTAKKPAPSRGQSNNRPTRAPAKKKKRR